MRIVLVSGYEFDVLCARLKAHRPEGLPMIPFFQVPHIWIMQMNLVIMSAEQVTIGRYVSEDVDVSLFGIEKQMANGTWKQLSPERERPADAGDGR